MIDIKETLNSKGWPKLVTMMRDKLEQVDIPENGDLAEIGQRYLAKSMALKAFDRAIAEMEVVKRESEKKEISYK